MPPDQSEPYKADAFLKAAGTKILTYAEAMKEDAQQLAREIHDWYYQEKTNQAENRVEQAVDASFYDGDQWNEAEKKELLDRNQSPSVINLIKPTIDWLTGTEKRARIDWEVLPTRDGDSEAALAKTHALKYIVHNNHGEYKRSQAFGDAVKVGIGWREFGVRGDITDDPIYIGYESWRNILYDSQANDPMFIEDGRYIFRRKVVDLDVAIAMFPHREGEIRNAALTTYQSHWEYINSDIQLYYNSSQDMVHNSGDAFATHNNRRLVVALVECWYRKPVTTKHVKMSDTIKWGTLYDPMNTSMRDDVEDPFTATTLYDKVTLQMHVCMFIDPGYDHSQGLLLMNCRSPYNHNLFPFVPIWAYRKDEDNRPYGVVRNQRDPQRDFNKRHSKAQFLLSTRGVVYESGAVDDEDKLAEEIARPDFVIKKQKDHDLEIVEGKELAAAHISIANLDEQYIRQSSGVTGENLGLETNARSGVAIRNRQNEGGVVTEDLFDNLAMHDQVSGEILLSLAEQYMDMPMDIPMQGDHGREFLKINTPAPDGMSLLNDISRTKAEFVISKAEYHATVRQSMFDKLMDMMSSMDSQIILQLLDVVIDLSDIPERKEIVRRIRQINGHKDPTQVTQEEMAAEEMAKAQARQEEQALQSAVAEAKIRKTNADAAVQEGRAAVQTGEAIMLALEAAGISLVVSPQQVQMAKDQVEEARASAQPPPLQTQPPPPT